MVKNTCPNTNGIITHYGDRSRSAAWSACSWKTWKPDPGSLRNGLGTRHLRKKSQLRSQIETQWARMGLWTKMVPPVASSHDLWIRLISDEYSRRTRDRMCAESEMECDATKSALGVNSGNEFCDDVLHLFNSPLSLSDTHTMCVHFSVSKKYNNLSGIKRGAKFLRNEKFAHFMCILLLSS